MEKPPAPVGVPSAGVGIKRQLAAIRVSYERIRDGDENYITSYNYSVARLVEDLEASGLNPWGGSVPIPGKGGVVRLQGRAPNGTTPLRDQLIPADKLAFQGKFSEVQSKSAGIGAPLVLVTSFKGIGYEEVREHLPVRNLTAIVRFQGETAILELTDPYQIGEVAVAGKARPLAADYGAGLMLALSKARVDKLGLARLLRPSRYNDTAHLNFLQPYDPERIPVLMVHGLQDTPATFAPMYFKLMEDPAIRENYQFWVFSYPSGYPYPYSASLLRRELDKTREQFPDHRNIVIIGHSMGSLVSRLMVTDAGDKLWTEAFGRNPSKTRLAGRSDKILRDSLIFSDRKEIDRAVFYSGPHRGSVLASNWIGATASRLVKVPHFIADTRNIVLSAATADVQGLLIQSAPNSIGTLSPDNPFVVAINKIPIVPRVPYHSIMGDRGKNDTPESSDGVVAYWSSCLDGAVSEKIVPSDHSSHQHLEGISEARRILHLHLDQTSR